MVDILQTAGAEDFIPKFARHRVSIETMIQMTEEDLREVGHLDVFHNRRYLKTRLCVTQFVIPTWGKMAMS